MLKEVIKYDVEEAVIAEIKAKSKDLQVTNPTERKEVAKHISQLVSFRTTVENRRKELKKDALEYGKRVDTEANRIKGVILEVESPLKALKEAYDAKKKAEKEEKERIEAERVSSIQNKISYLKGLIPNAVSQSIDELTEIITSMKSYTVTKGIFQEFTDEATIVMTETLSKLEEMLAGKVAQKAEEVRIAHEAKELEAKRIEQAEEQAERDAKDKAERDAFEAEKKVFEEEKALAAKKAKAEKEALSTARAVEEALKKSEAIAPIPPVEVVGEAVSVPTPKLEIAQEIRPSFEKTKEEVIRFFEECVFDLRHVTDYSEIAVIADDITNHGFKVKDLCLKMEGK